MNIIQKSEAIKTGLRKGYCQELCANMFAVSGRTRSAGNRGVLAGNL